MELVIFGQSKLGSEPLDSFGAIVGSPLFHCNKRYDQKTA